MAAWLSIEQVADVCYGAGFRGEALAIAIAVTRPEAGGGAPAGAWADAGAIGDVRLANATWGPSVGIFQVRTVNAERGSGSTRDYDALIASPAQQAKAAYAIVGGNVTTGSSNPNRGWGHWSTWKAGTHRPFLDQARQAAQAREAGGGSGAIGGGGSTSPAPAPAPAPVISPDLLIRPGELSPSYRPPATIESLVIEGSARTEDLARLITAGGSVELTSAEVSELTFSIVNEGPLRLGSGRGLITLGARVRWAGHRFTIGAVELAPGVGGELANITARNEFVQRLRRTNRNDRTGGLTGTSAAGIDTSGRNLSPTEYAALQAKFVTGLAILGQGSARRSNIAAVKGDDGVYESPWEVMVRLAGEEGFLCFVAGSTLYYGKPSFLAAHATEVKVGYRGSWGDRTLDVIGTPVVRDSVDDYDGATIELLLPRWRGEQVRPGMRLATKGLNGFGTEGWLVHRVSWPLDGGIEPVVVEGRAPVDPLVKAREDPAATTADPASSTSPTGSTTTTPYTGKALSEAERLAAFGQPGDRSRITTVRTPWGMTVSVNVAVKARFLMACDRAASVSSWKPRRIDSLAVRKIRGYDEWSLHAWALAWDFFSSPPGVPPPGGVWGPESAPDSTFRAAFASVGFRLGANYSGRKDYPHIEWAAGPPPT